MTTPADGTSETTQQQQAQVSEPTGDGPVTLEQRTEPGGQGSPDTNQGKAEPLSPTPDHPEPLAVPQLSDLNVGAGDPQAASHPAAAARAHTGAASLARGAGGVTAGPDAHPEGTAHRAPGQQGATPAGESTEVDVEAGAARATPADGATSSAGDPASVPGTGSQSLAGSSQTQEPVDGVRLPGGT